MNPYIKSFAIICGCIVLSIGILGVIAFYHHQSDQARINALVKRVDWYSDCQRAGYNYFQCKTFEGSPK